MDTCQVNGSEEKCVNPRVLRMAAILLILGIQKNEVVAEKLVDMGIATASDLAHATYPQLCQAGLARPQCLEIISWGYWIDA